MIGGVTPQGVILPLQATPNIEAETLQSFLRAQASDVIPKLYAYLEEHGPKHAQLASCIPLVQQAAEFYRLGDYIQAFNAGYYAYRQLKIMSSQVAELPGPLERSESSSS